MDGQNEVLKDLFNRLTLFITDDWIAESDMIDVPKEIRSQS